MVSICSINYFFIQKHLESFISGTPSFWWIMAVNGKRLGTELSRRKEREEEERMERETVDQSNSSGYSSFNSFMSTLNTSPDEWTTVSILYINQSPLLSFQIIITGSDNSFWFGSCAPADVIRISMKKFNRYVKNLVRGSFYRVKLSRGDNGDVKVNDIDRDPVYPKDIEVDTTKTLQVWSLFI